MSPLPFPLFPLVCVSTVSAVLTLTLTIFAFNVSILLWIVPPAFIITFAIHAIFLLLSNSKDDTASTLRVYSASLISSFFFAIAVWTGTTAVLVLCAVHLLTGRIPSPPHRREWAIITASVFSLLETAFMAAIAVKAYKVRQRLRYREKWRWRPAATSSQWSIAQTSAVILP